MEECEAAYLAASTPVVTDMEPTTTLESCSDASGWWVNDALTGLSGWDATTMRLCESDGQYAVEYNGAIYPTCVAYGNPGDDCTNDDLICPENNNNPGPGKFGWAGNHRAALASALTRADFNHPTCPTRTCSTMDFLANSNVYWRDQMMNNPYTPLTESQANAICITEDNRALIVTAEGKYNTCVGWSQNHDELCDSGKFLCAGNDGEGLFAFGWAGQIARTLAVAAANEAGNYMHPQCPLAICKA